MSAPNSDTAVNGKVSSGVCSWTYGLYADVVLWFLLWCVLAELPNRIFFPALVVMGFSGLEVLLGVHLLTALIGINHVWHFTSNWNSLFLLLALPSFYWYGELEDHYNRSIYIGAAVMFLSFAAQGILFQSMQRSNRLMWGQNLSLLSMISVRFAFKSALPVWSFHRSATPQWKATESWSFEAPECDKWVACLGLVAALILWFEILPLPHIHTPAPTMRWFVHALAMGCNQFLLFWLFTCHSVVPRWVGVDSTQFGPYIILGLFAGYALSSHWAIIRHPLFSIIGCGGGYLLYYAGPTLGFLGGLAVAVFVSASTTITYISVFKCARVKGRVLFVSQLTFVFLEFTTVWNIAYMFLDLGNAFRESPHYSLFFSLCIIALNNMMQPNLSVRGDVPAVAWKSLAFIFLLITCPSYYFRHTHATTHPHNVDISPDTDVKVMIWNVHTGYADNGYDNYQLAADFAQSMKAGVIAILESDQTRVVTGNRDQVEFLGASLGFKYHNYGVQTRDSTWGCSFISLYPIMDSNITVLPSPFGTRSCLIDAVLDIYGREFNVVVSHFSTEEFPEDLKLQTAALSKMAESKTTMPLTVLCYITSAPESAYWYKASDRENYITLTTNGTLRDPDPTDTDRWCQYIFYKNTRVKKYYHVDTGYMSDTEAQLADIEYNPSCGINNTDGNDVPICSTSEPVVAEFYKYFVDRRELKYWYTGAKRSQSQRPSIS